MKKLIEKFLIGQMLKSKKFWYTIVAVVVQLLHDAFGLNPEETEAILHSIIALIIGQGIADISKSNKK
jgi:hypothetical protein|tara:strand:- start:896 stop:1099 length:204 start_codon:yes stop_codon:yes gene_type:complete